MKNKYFRSFINSSISILPIVLIVFVLSLTGLAKISDYDYTMLSFGAVAMIIGLSFFQIGAQNSLVKVGEYMGASLSKQKNLFIVIFFAFLLGALITCAEPSILIVSKQAGMNPIILIGSIAGGVGVFVVIGILRIVFQKSLNLWYLAFYLIVFMLVCVLQVDAKNHAFLPFIFDAGGITTGSATVPFILSLGAGVAMTRGGGKSKDSSFGLVGLASVGPIITMIVLILTSPSGFSPYVVTEPTEIAVSAASPDFWKAIGNSFSSSLLPSGANQFGSMVEVAIALAPILVIFFIYELIFIRLSLKKILNLFIGFIVAFIGLTVFLTAVGAAMSPIGLKAGLAIANQPDWLLITLAFAIGAVTILCEPAVHVLTTQIENMSSGQVKKGTVLITLSIGVGVAICLSVIRTLYKFSIMYYIIPGYMISLLLMFVVPELFTAIAFDSGGTASGPMAVSFVLPFIIGIHSIRNEGVAPGFGSYSSINVYESAFGVVAMVAMTPILAIQLLGVVGKLQTIHALHVVRDQIHDERNNEIIHFC